MKLGRGKAAVMICGYIEKSDNDCLVLQVGASRHMHDDFTGYGFARQRWEAKDHDSGPTDYTYLLLGHVQ